MSLTPKSRVSDAALCCVAFAIMACTVLGADALFGQAPDDPPASSSSETPAVTADYTLLLKRLEALEARIRALEQKDDGSVGQEIGEPTEATVEPQKPILNVRTEEWCAPCQRFKRELAALQADYQQRGIDFPVEVRINPAGIRWSSNQIPQFNFSESGRTVNLVGYNSGQLVKMIERMKQ